MFSLWLGNRHARVDLCKYQMVSCLENWSKLTLKQHEEKKLKKFKLTIIHFNINERRADAGHIVCLVMHGLDYAFELARDINGGL